MAYIDANLSRTPNDRKIIYDYTFLFSSSLISWTNKKKQSIPLSIVEEKYMVASSTYTQAISMAQLF